MEAVEELAVDFARVVVVGAAEGETVVAQRSVVGYVHGRDAELVVLAEIFARRQLDRVMLRKLVSGVLRGLVAVVESRAVGHVDGTIGA